MTPRTIPALLLVTLLAACGGGGGSSGGGNADPTPTAAVTNGRPPAGSRTKKQRTAGRQTSPQAPPLLALTHGDTAASIPPRPPQHRHRRAREART